MKFLPENGGPHKGKELHHTPVCLVKDLMPYWFVGSDETGKRECSLATAVPCDYYRYVYMTM